MPKMKKKQKLLRGSAKNEKQGPDSHKEDPERKPPSKPPDNTPLEDEDIINLIKRTCIKLACKEIMEINYVTQTQEPRPYIEINT